jgi:hypothetical protein
MAENQGIDDALIQPYSGHASSQSLEIYSRLSSPTPNTPTTKPSPTSQSEPDLTAARHLAPGDTDPSAGP